jgi:hypothetical protein
MMMLEQDVATPVAQQFVRVRDVDATAGARREKNP